MTITPKLIQNRSYEERDGIGMQKAGHAGEKI